MAINATAVWRTRIGGADTNSGGFDPAIVGEGTDYTEQDTPQLTVTDLAAAGAGTTLTSATGGFTSAMIGNSISISGGTGWTTAARYFITAVTNTNTIVVDRNASAGAASGGTCRVGGAFATLAGSGSYAIAGNAVLVRGQGSNDPADIDFVTSSALPHTNGVTFVGYNGRPKIGHVGRLFWNNGGYFVKNFYFIQTAGTYTTEGVVNASAGTVLDNCVIDSGGFDATQVTNGGLFNSSLINTGTQVVGTRPCVNNSLGGMVYNCLIKDQRFTGIELAIGYSNVVGCVIQNCAGDGIYSPTNQPYAGRHSHVINNTIHNCGGHGINTQNALVHIQNNLITNITGAGKYGLYVASGGRAAAQDYGKVCRNNFYGCTNNSNLTISALDTTNDPQYVNAPVDLTPTNTALRYLSGIGSA